MFWRTRHMREQRIVLEHHAEAAVFGLQLIDALVVEPDAAAGQVEQAGDAVERRRLAATRRPEQRDEFAPCGRSAMTPFSALTVPKVRLIRSSRNSRKSRAA